MSPSPRAQRSRLRCPFHWQKRTPSAFSASPSLWTSGKARPGSKGTEHGASTAAARLVRRVVIAILCPGSLSPSGRRTYLPPAEGRPTAIPRHSAPFQPAPACFRFFLRKAPMEPDQPPKCHDCQSRTTFGTVADRRWGRRWSWSFLGTLGRVEQCEVSRTRLAPQRRLEIEAVADEPC